MANQERKGFFGKSKDKVLWAAEKSTWVTLPITAGLFAARKISFETAVILAAIDIGGSVAARRMRRKDSGSSATNVSMKPGKQYSLAA